MLVHPHLGFFPVLEGIDGCGKGKQAERLVNRLLELGPIVIHTREPGGKDMRTGREIVVAEELRRTMITPRENLDDSPTPMAELFNMAASRTQHVDRLIRPELKAGSIVLSERYYQSTRAYQIHGRGLDDEFVERVIYESIREVEPDIVIILDVPAVIAAARKKAQAQAKGESLDRFEGEGLEFLERVRQGYLQIAEGIGNYHVVDGTASIEEVAEKIWELISASYSDRVRLSDSLQLK